MRGARSPLFIVLALIGIGLPDAALSFPNEETSLGRILGQFTHRYDRAVVLVKALRPVGPALGTSGYRGGAVTERAVDELWSSGVVVDREGHVLTCMDVAQPTDSLFVQAADGRLRAARFVSQDVRTGLSLVRVEDAEGLVPAEPCTAGAPVREGDWLVLLTFDPTTGSVDPRLGRLERIVPPTNSGSKAMFRVEIEGKEGGCGSAIVDGNGDLVGMVVECEVGGGPGPFLRSRGGPASEDHVQGLPRSLVFEMAGHLLASSRAHVGFLGVQAALRSLASASADSSDLLPAPVEVKRVRPGSPAEQAGLLVGDVLLGLGGVAVDDVTSVSERISAIQPGTWIAIDILRGGARVRIDAKIGERTSLDWMETRLSRNLGKQRRIEEQIRELGAELDELRDLQRRFQ